MTPRRPDPTTTERSASALGGSPACCGCRTWNYTLFTAEPDSGTVTVQFIGDDSLVLDQITLEL